MELVLTALLLANPDTAPSKPLVAFLSPTILTVLVSAELASPREAAQYRDSLLAGDWSSVAALCRSCAGLPRLADSHFHFDPALLAESVKINRAFRAMLIGRRQVDLFRVEEIDDAICKADQLHYAYELAVTAADMNCAILMRRQALSDLRAAIGERAFHSGVLPAAVPMRHLVIGQ